MEHIKIEKCVKFFILSFIITFNVKAQSFIVSYKNLDTALFNSNKRPVNIALFPITENGKPSKFVEKIYDEMSKEYNSQHEILFYPYNVIQEQLKIKNFDPDNLKTLQNIRKNLEIEFIVFGQIIDLKSNWFKLKIANTQDGKVLFDHEFRNSDSSTGIKDAVELLYNGKVASYIKTGKLVIKIQPKDATIKIDSTKYPNHNEILLSTGYHEIKISKKGYELISDTVKIEYSKEIIKNYILKRKLGNLKVITYPSKANIKMMLGDSVINNWEGDKLISNVPTGDYQIQCVMTGYETQTKTINIKANVITQENIQLIRNSFPSIVSNNEKIKDLRVEQSGQDLVIYYNLDGEPDDDYEIKLLLVNKNSGILYEPKSFTGNIGKGKFAGKDRKITWKVENDFPWKFIGEDYELKLQGEKLGGGIAWYIYALGGAVAGGIAAILLRTKVVDGGKHPIGNPPVRP